MSQKVYITHIASFLPNSPVSNREMEAVLGQVSDKPSRARNLVLRSNKIISRYYAVDPLTGKSTHTNAKLTAEAITKLTGQGCRLEDIELLACGTTLPDQLLPNHSLMVQGELQLHPCETVATAGICLSGLMALKYAYLSIAAGESANAVATGSENSSSIMRGHCFTREPARNREQQLVEKKEIAFEKDFLRWMLSDGAGAVWMSNRKKVNGNSLRIDWIKQISYAGRLPICMYAGGEKTTDGRLRGWREYLADSRGAGSVMNVKQDVKLLNDKIIDYTITRPLTELVKKKLVAAEKIDWFLPHYSSGYFRDKVYDGIIKAGCDIPQKRWFTNLQDKGNTGSASIYIMLEELFNSGKLNRGETLLCYVPESGRFSTGFMHLTVV